MNIKYRVKFETKNASIAEKRELKINLLSSNYVMEFDSDSIPSIPKVSSKVNICNELYVILDIVYSYVMEGSQVYNLILISVESEKSIERRESERRAAEIKERMYNSRDIYKQYLDYNKYDNDFISTVKAGIGNSYK